MRGVVGWFRPGSRFAFQRQVRQMHRTHRTQGIIFADVYAGVICEQSNIPPKLVSLLHSFCFSEKMCIM